MTLADLARLTDVFYIGGTKCGSLFGEAVVIPERGSIRQFVTQMKQHGALLAKGRLLGVQFEALFEDGLYLVIGEPAVKATARIREALKRAGYVVTMDSPTNLTFVALDQAGHERLSDKVRYSIWETLPDGRYLARIGTSWATPRGGRGGLRAGPGAVKVVLLRSLGGVCCQSLKCAIDLIAYSYPYVDFGGVKWRPLR